MYGAYPLARWLKLNNIRVSGLARMPLQRHEGFVVGLLVGTKYSP
jgi:hypothetical protein